MTNAVSDLRTRLSADIAAAGGYVTDPPELAGAIGRTMFDLPGSEDLTVTVLLPHGHLQKAPSQSLVRVKSVEDAKTYLGVVTAGPFAEPDSLKGDSPVWSRWRPMPRRTGRRSTAASWCQASVRNCPTARSNRRACGRYPIVRCSR